MGESILLGAVTGAIIGALLASGAHDLIKGLGSVVVLAGAAGGMGVTHLETWQSSHPTADAVNAAVIIWAIMGTKYAVAFWLAGVVSYFAAGTAVERIRDGQ